MSKLITVEIIYATASEQPLISLRAAAGATAEQAIVQSGILEDHPEIGNADIGIFGKPVPRDIRLRDGDRIEVYRPLIVEAKEERKRRANKNQR